MKFLTFRFLVSVAKGVRELAVYPTSKEVWNNLSQAFRNSGLLRKVGLLKDLIDTSLETSESVEEYVNKILFAAHKLRNISFHVDDEWLGTLMLAGLPAEYNPMIMGQVSIKIKSA